MPGAIRPPFDPLERELIPLQQLSGTLLNLALYLALVVLGAFLGSRPAVQSRPMPWLGRFQTAALLLLIVTLGAELGANDEIVTSLATIGLNALIITLTSMIGSLLAVHILRKHLLKLDAQGRSRKEAAQEETAREKNQVHVDHSLTILIVVTVVLGMLAGHLLLPASVTAHCGAVINLGLYLLLFLVGLDMGRQGNMLQDIRAAGFRVFLVPLAAAMALSCYQSTFGAALNGIGRQGSVAWISILCDGVQLAFTAGLVARPGVGMGGYVLGALVTAALGLALCAWQTARATGLRLRLFQWATAPGLAALLMALVTNLLYRVLRDSGLPLPHSLAATLLFGAVLYLAALNAQGVHLRELFRLK